MIEFIPTEPPRLHYIDHNIDIYFPITEGDIKDLYFDFKCWLEASEDSITLTAPVGMTYDEYQAHRTLTTNPKRKGAAQW
jgi:hypothetical protein